MAKKTAKYVVAGFLTLLLVGFLILTFSLDYLVKTNIEEIGTELTRTGVSVSSVSISPFTGKGSISGFSVANPDDFETGEALRIEQFDIEIDLQSILSNTIVVKDISITQPRLTVEQRLPANNLKTLMNNIESATTDSDSQTNMIIERIIIEDGSIYLRTDVGGEQERTIKLPAIELTDVGKGEQSVKQTVLALAEPVVEEALKAALKGGLEQLKENARDTLKDLFDN